MKSIEELLELVEEPHRSECFIFIDKNRELFDTSKGSAVKHQAWKGGYRDHITEVMNIAVVTYDALEKIRRLPFSLSDALFACFLHDVEKIWKHAVHPDDTLVCEHVRDDGEIQIDKWEILRTNFTLYLNIYIAVKYAHGEGDDYHPTERVQSPLAAFVHHCDNTSARIWFDYPARPVRRDIY